MAFIWDFGRVLWLTTLLVSIVWVPAALSTSSRRPSLTVVFEHFVIIATLAVIAVSILSPAHLLNPFTLLVAYACWPLGQWLVRHRGYIARDATAQARQLLITIITRAERGQQTGSLRHSIARTTAARCSELVAITHSVITPIGVLMAVAIFVALGPILAEALANRRLPTPVAYGELLTAQQLFAGELGWSRPRVVPALTTALSVVSAISPVHVVRLLVPITGAIAFLALITTVRVFTSSILPAIIGTLGAAVLWRGSGQMQAIGAPAVFLLLALLFCFQALDGARHKRWLAICASLLAALMMPASLVVIGAGLAMMLVAPPGALLAAGAAWVATGWITGSAAPLGGALCMAGVAHLAILHFRFARPPLRSGYAVAVAILGCAVVAPQQASASFVEYDASARATLEIANRFPKYRWMIVAPLEAWPLSFGRGWHVNLHEFVQDQAEPANVEGYRLPYQVDELFVFVETRPFASFAAEPTDVPFSTLVDPVYRHYRSPAGRSSLQFAAHRLSERLLEQHPGGSIYFDDGRLRIYRFTLR